MSPLEIRQDITLIKNGKLTQSQLIDVFVGFSYQLILDKGLFKNNSDLEAFVKRVFLSPIDEAQFRPYVYKSRTLLGSRISRLIISFYSIEVISSSISAIEEILNNIYPDTFNVKNRKNLTNPTSIDGALTEWIKSVRDRDNG